MKSLITNLDAQREELVMLKKEIQELKNAASAAPVPPPAETEISAEDASEPGQPIESDTDEKPLSLHNLAESQDIAEKINLKQGEDKH